MNSSHLWKILSGLPLTDMLIALFLIALALAGVGIALWAGVPLAFAYLRELWRAHWRRRARRRRYAAGTTIPRQSSTAGHRAAAKPALSGWPLTARFAVAGCAVLSILAGVVLGYVLNRQPDRSSLSAQLTEVLRDPARLRIDYELRNR